VALRDRGFPQLGSRLRAPGSGLLVIFAAAAVLHTWPLATDPAGLSRLDNDDTGLNTWIISWVAHALATGPLALFDASMFFPERRTLAYSEHLLVPTLMGAPLLWAGASPVLVYNLLVLAGMALSGWTMSLVVRAWTGSLAAGVTAGLLFAFNAHLLTRLPHLQALHVEFLPVALWAIDRVFGLSAACGLRRAAVAGAMLTIAFVFQALSSYYALVMLTGALAVASLVRAPEWLGPGRGVRFNVLAGAGVASTLLLLPFLWPYYAVSRDMGVRTITEVGAYSAGPLDYLATAGRLHYGLWSSRIADGRTALFPGVTAAVLVVWALARPDLRRDARVRMVAAIGLAGLALSFGPALPGYAWLHAHVPLLQGMRAAARWGFLLLTAVAILAGYAVAALQVRLNHSPYRMAVVVGVAGLVTLEALRAPMGFVPFTGIPRIYERLATEAGVVLVELPMFSGSRVSENARYLVANTVSHRPLVNGYSGLEPPSYAARVVRWQRFPDGLVIDDMRGLGVTHVMLHLGDLEPDVIAAASASPDLALVADDGQRRLYRLARLRP
jgi:hypothetical protein